MSSTVSNPSGDRNDKIANAAKVLGKSKQRLAVFKSIYTNKIKVKTMQEIVELSGIKSKQRILELVKPLVSEDIV